MHEVKARMQPHPDIYMRSIDGTRVQLGNDSVLLDIEVYDGCPPPSLTIKDGLQPGLWSNSQEKASRGTSRRS